MLRYALILAILNTAQLHAETWTDVTGKFTVDAEFVALSEGVLSLRKVDGQIVQVPMAKLGTDSKQQAERLAKEIKRPAQVPMSATPTTEPEPTKQDPGQAPVGQVSVDVKQVTASEKKWYQANNVISKIEKVLKLELDLSGPLALDAREYGFLNLKYVRGDGKPLIRKKSPVFDISDHFREIGNLLGARVKDSQLLIPLELKDAEKTPETVSLGGSIKLLTGGTKSSIVLSDLQTGLIGRSKLKRTGLWVHVEVKKEKELFVRVDDPDGTLESLAFTNAADEILKGVTSGSHDGMYQGRRVRVHHIEFKQSVPVDTRVVLNTRVDPVTITVPFKFDNIPVKHGK